MTDRQSIPEDLYEVLGVPRGVSTEIIKATFRRRAKSLHPDTGAASTEAFVRLHAAYKTLVDPDKRAAYDKDGTTNFEADNERALALELVSRMFDGVMATFSDADCETPVIDVVEVMRDNLRNQIAAMSEKVAKLEGAQTRLTKFAKRFSADDGESFLGQMVEAKVRSLGGAIKGTKRQLDLHEAALELLKDQKFKFEQPPYQSFVQMAQLGGMGQPYASTSTTFR